MRGHATTVTRRTPTGRRERQYASAGPASRHQSLGTVPRREQKLPATAAGNESALIHFTAANAASDVLQMHYLIMHRRAVLAAQLNFFFISRVGFSFNSALESFRMTDSSLA